jgi:hypothetical protein
MSAMTALDRFLRPWTTPPTILTADLTSIDERLTDIGARLENLATPTPPTRTSWLFWIILVVVFGVGISGLVWAADLTSDTAQTSSQISAVTDALTQLSVGVTSLQDDILNNEIAAIQATQAGNQAAALKDEKTAKKYVAVVTYLRKTETIDFGNLQKINSSQFLYNQQRKALILASLSSVIVGGILSYAVIVLADWARARRVP